MRLRVFQIFPLRIFENDPQKFSNFASRMRVALLRIFTTLVCGASFVQWKSYFALLSQQVALCSQSFSLCSGLWSVFCVVLCAVVYGVEESNDKRMFTL